MKLSSLHRTTGLILLIPLCLWAITGAFFLIKPGYDLAYQKIAIHPYPLANNKALQLNPAQHKAEWLELRHLATTLGEHLLVKDKEGWQQLDPVTLTERALPTAEQLKNLVSDAIKNSPTPDRYGTIIEQDKLQFTTDTGVLLTLDWPTLQLTQKGNDTRFISNMYKLHYLQWTGHSIVDGIIEVLILSLLILLTLIGAKLSFKKPK